MARPAGGGTSLTDYTNVVVVDAGGKGDYTTQAAALAAITNDDASHIYNVFVAVAWWAGVGLMIADSGLGAKIWKA